MTPTLRLFSIGLSVLIVAGSARAQYVSPTGNSFPSRMPGTQANTPNDFTSPLRPVDSMQMPPGGNQGVLNPMPAENLGRPPCKPDQPWIAIAPYVWAVGMKGTVSAGFATARIDRSPWDATGDAFSDLRGAVGLYLEAGVGNVGFIADLMYLDARPEDRLLRVEEKATILELLGFYRLVDTGPCAGGCTLDVLAGGRHYRFGNSISLQPFDLSLGDKTNSWWDLVVGLRGSVQVTNSLALFGRADYGGFGISGSSTRACNYLLGFDWQCTDCLSIYGGYRWFKIDRTSGDGFDYFKLDVTMSGPFVAVGLRF